MLAMGKWIWSLFGKVCSLTKLDVVKMSRCVKRQWQLSLAQLH